MTEDNIDGFGANIYCRSLYGAVETTAGDLVTNVELSEILERSQP